MDIEEFLLYLQDYYGQRGKRRGGLTEPNKMRLPIFDTREPFARENDLIPEQQEPPQQQGPGMMQGMMGMMPGMEQGMMPGMGMPGMGGGMEGMMGGGMGGMEGVGEEELAMLAQLTGGGF